MDMKIEVCDVEHVEDEALQTAVVRALRQRAASTVIYVSPRHKDGWLEYLIVYTYASGSKLTVGMIQRQRDAEYEFHS